MTYVFAMNPNLTDRKILVSQLVDDRVSGKIIETDGKKRGRKISSKSINQGFVRRRWTPDMNLNCGIVKRKKISQAHHVVYMKMSEKYMYFCKFCTQVSSKALNSGPGIQNNTSI